MACKHYALITLTFFLIALNALAQTEPAKPISFGHNLSPSTETLAKGQATIGSYFIGAGVTDNLLVGFSPWITLGYNLDNFIIKFKHAGFKDDAVTHQLAYFNTNSGLGNRYDQTSMSYWLTYGRAFERYHFSTTINYMYFWQEKRPFSLRREPFNNQAQQITLTTLHQFYFTESTILQLELGVLGINYAYPNLAAGASWLHYLSPSWSLQLGGSISQRFSFKDMQNQSFDTSYIHAYENYAAESIHPEIQLQYWF